MAKNICKATVWPVFASGMMDKSVFLRIRDIHLQESNTPQGFFL